MHGMRRTALWLLCAASTAPAAEPGREDVIARVRSLATDGVEVERLARAYNLVAGKVFERLPQLRLAARQLRLPERFADAGAFSEALLGFAESINPRLVHTSERAKADLIARLEEWLSKGRIRLGEATFWYLTRDESWRQIERLRRTRVGLARPDAGGEGDRKPVGAGVPWSLPSLDPHLVRMAAAALEDFLTHYEEGATPIPAATPEEFGRIVTGSDPASPGARAPGLRDLKPDPLVARGLERLCADLCREVLGLDPRTTARLVEGLPAARDGVILITGYAVRAGEPAGLLLLPVLLDYLHLSLGERFAVHWVRGRDDLEAALVDPALRRVVLMEHASLSSFAFEGLTGPPQESLPCLLEWIRLRANDLAPHLEKVLHDGDTRPLASFLSEELDAGWRRWELADLAALAARPDFVPKDRITLFACAVDEVVVEAADKRFRDALLEELQAHPDAGEWLSFDARDAVVTLEPLWPDADARFRAGLPTLLQAAKRRWGQKALRVAARPDFLKLLARETRRFPGTASGYDYARHPVGFSWDPADLVRRIEKALEE